MKKLVLTIAIVLTSLSGYSNDKAEMNDDSYACRLQAYNAANATDYAYGSEDWQFVYWTEKTWCEADSNIMK